MCFRLLSDRLNFGAVTAISLVSGFLLAASEFRVSQDCWRERVEDKIEKWKLGTVMFVKRKAKLNLVRYVGQIEDSWSLSEKAESCDRRQEFGT